MMNEKNYTKDDKGLSKLRGLLNHPIIVMMATHLEKIPFAVCPMTIQQMDEQGDLWLFTARNSDHFKNIELDNRVQLMYSDKTKDNYISMYGNATHIVDKQKVSELWSERLNQWFEGQEDPNLALLNINLENAFYWDVGAQKLVSLLENVMDGEPSGGTPEKGHINLQDH